LVDRFPARFSLDNVSVVHLPLPQPRGAPESPESCPVVCFIGYRTRDKGFEAFRWIASKRPDIRFRAIGNGVVEDVATGIVEPLHDKDSYLAEIAKCSLAIFPYRSGYTASLSAAAMDALAVGVPLVALDRPCFRSLAEYFGREYVRVCESVEEMIEVLALMDLASSPLRRVERLEVVCSSKYGPDSVRTSMEGLASASRARPDGRAS